MVIVPSGAYVEIIAIFPMVDEVLIQYPNGEAAQLKAKFIRPLPGKGDA